MHRCCAGEVVPGRDRRPGQGDALARQRRRAPRAPHQAAALAGRRWRALGGPHQALRWRGGAGAWLGDLHRALRERGGAGARPATRTRRCASGAAPAPDAGPAAGGGATGRTPALGHKPLRSTPRRADAARGLRRREAAYHPACFRPRAPALVLPSSCQERARRCCQPVQGAAAHARASRSAGRVPGACKARAGRLHAGCCIRVLH